MKKLALRCLLLGLTLGLTGCQTIGYYAQAINGQRQILSRQKSIASLLEDPATPDALKEQLRFVLEIRAFAEKQLALPANGHYLNYADLGRRFAVWNVHAAPAFSLKPKSWWYPVVGRLNYRGYFSEQRARRYAARLQRQGYDVYVGGVVAYSTLGWFRDPVLNTFVNEQETELAELLFHELAHQRLFVAGDTDFNEAFATAVAEEGMRRWLHSRNDPAATRKYEAEIGRTEQFVRVVSRARAKLQALYAEPGPSDALASRSNPGEDHSAADLRHAKQLILDELRRDYERLKADRGGREDYDQWFRQPLNNAQLNTVETYYRLVPAFRQLIQQHRGDLEQFYEATRALGKLSKTERHLRLDGFSNAQRGDGNEGG